MELLISFFIYSTMYNIFQLERSRFFKIRRKIATQNRKIYYSKRLLGDKLKNTILKIKTIKIKKK